MAARSIRPYKAGEAAFCDKYEVSSRADGFYFFLRMTSENYNELLRLIEPLISGNDTSYMKHS